MQPGVTPQTEGQVVIPGINATGATVTTTSGVQGSQTGQTVQTGQTGGEASLNITTQVQGGVQGAPSQAAHPGIYHGAFVYNRAVHYYIPPAHYNAHIVARHKEFLESRGLSRVRK